MEAGEKEFLLKEYEIIAARLSSSDSYCASFVSIYLVLQTALLAGLGLSLDSDSKINFLQNTFLPINPFALVGLFTTLWAFSVTGTYFNRIVQLDKRMIELERKFLGDACRDAYVSMIRESDYSKPLRAFLSTVSIAVLLIFMGTWAVVAANGA